MATPAICFDKEGKRLAKLLCEAAGVDAAEVRSISCHCAWDEVVTFKIEKFTDEQKIKAAIEREIA
jgi:hypothetical protein